MRSLVISNHVNLVFVRYFDEMYVVFPLVVACERRLHDTSPLFGPRGSDRGEGVPIFR